MNTTGLRVVWVALAGLSMFPMTGCKDQKAGPGQLTQSVNTNKAETLKDLEAKVGISFPTNAVIINSSDGGGREPSHQFYEWALFSPSPITMPLMRATGVTGYLNMPLGDTVTFVESRLRKRKIKQPQSAFETSWETNGLGFSGTLVRSAEGDYLIITQGRAK